MRTTTMRVTGAACLLAAVAAGGCRGRDTTAPSDDALARDLASASEAVNARAAGRTRFVSPLEAGLEQPGAESAPSPRAAARSVRAVRARHATARLASRASVSHAASVAVSAAASGPGSAAGPAPAAGLGEHEGAMTETSVAVAAPESEAPPAPSEPVAHGPQPDEAPAEAGAPDEQGRPRRRGGIGWGRILGGIGSVVIRGGSVGDDDHCERDEPPRRRRGGWGGLDPMGGDRTMPTRGAGRVGGPILPRY